MTTGILPQVQTGREGMGRDQSELRILRERLYHTIRVIILFPFPFPFPFPSFSIPLLIFGAFCVSGAFFEPADSLLNSITVVIAEWLDK